MDDTDPSATLRIGELSRRLGVSDHALRAWERRYGLLRPVRTVGGYRLYSEADFERVRRMQAHLAAGLSTAQAAQAALEEDRAAADTGPVEQHDTMDGALQTLTQALDELDERTAHLVIDRLLNIFTIETVLREVLLPYLRHLGERWASGAVSIAQEHFASNVVRGRLTSIGRGWGHGHGPRALLACVPGELHDIALIAFGIVLSRRGWHVQYLGANTPVDDLVRVASTRRTDLIVLVGTTPERFDDVTPDLTRLAAVAPVAIGGPGATRAVADTVGAQLLTGDPVSAAESVTAANDHRAYRPSRDSPRSPSPPPPAGL
jgi:MerR family transcriptional regulator, light-induced transcriptional regulator